jgi:hypothetical protein
VRLFGRRQELFPRDKFTIEDVGVQHREDTANRLLTLISNLSVQMGTLHCVESCDGF